MFANLSGWHLLIVLAVVLLIFGAAKLPGLAKSAGQSARIFKGEMKAMKTIDDAPDAAAHTASEIEARGVELAAPLPDAAR
jgi:sec-independent protein translocase protein TatA